MEEKYLKEISQKLTVIIKLLIRSDGELIKGGLEQLIGMVDGIGLSNEEIASIAKVAPKTVANVKSKMRSKN